jgi:hypothetical protein
LSKAAEMKTSRLRNETIKIIYERERLVHLYGEPGEGGSTYAAKAHPSKVQRQAWRQIENLDVKKEALFERRRALGETV